MKTCRMSIAMLLSLLIPLLTLQIGDVMAGRNAKSDPEIILEEVIISGSGNNTRVTANALADDASKIGDQILSLLSKGEIRRRRRSKQTPSTLDRDEAQSRITDVNDEDVERLKRVIAKYEPQRITSRKTKRKILEVPNDTHDVLDKTASTTDLERAYAEMLRNISRKVPELVMNNADMTSNPYLPQVMKNLKQIYIPNVTIRPATDGGEQKSRSVIDSSYTPPLLKSKKVRKSFKKYSRNHTVTTPRVSSVGESRTDEEAVNDNESVTPQGYFQVSSAKTKPKNESLPQSLSNIYSNPTEKLGSHREWNVQDSSSQIVSPFTSRLNSSNDLNNVRSNVNAGRLLSRYNTIPRPFSMSQSPNPPVRTSLELSHKKPSSSSPVGFNHQQIARSSANVLPLVLPTDFFNPLSARRYVRLKHANHLDGNTATIVSTEATSPTSPMGARTTLADYGTLYADVIGTTKSPLVAVNGQRNFGSSDYYAITENPVERTVARTNSVYIPSQTSASYTLQRQTDPQTVRKNEFLPRITTYDHSPGSEKSNLNEDPGIALYNKFASLYSTNTPNVLNAPKIITRDYQDFKQPAQSSPTITSQQFSTLPYATVEPTLVALPKVRPIAAVKPALAPYYDSKLLISQSVDGKFNGDKDNEENVETNERLLAENADESEKEVADDTSVLGNYKTETNREAYKIHKAPNEERKKEDREEEEKENRYSQQRLRNYGYYERDSNDENEKNDDEREKYENNEDERYQQRRDYEHQDRHREYDNDKDGKNNDRHERYKNLQGEANEDKEDTDETQGEEYVNTGKSEDEDNHEHQYNKYGYDRDDFENQRNKQRYDRKKYDKPKGKHNHETDVKQRLESNNKYSVSYNDDDIHGYNKEYRDRDEQDKSSGDNRQDRRLEDSDDESVTEDKSFAERFKDQRAPKQREKYNKKQNKDDDAIYKRKYRHRHHHATPRKDHEERRREEYSETIPKHVREEYHHHHQRVKGDHRKHDSGDQNDGKGEASDHVHGETKEHEHKHEEKKHGGDHKFEESGGAEHHEEHHGHEGEKGDKGYKVWHEHEKAEKGHHDKEHASKEYEEKDGEEKKHEEEGGYHEEKHHGEEGKKTAEFGEKGEHKKGHSTHGEHSVHKKDEYEKNTEFFDEFHEDGGAEKHGEHHHGHESKKGGHEKKGHHDAADHEEKYGKEEKHEKGGHHHEHKGHKVDEGHDHHYDRDHKYGKKEGHEHGKKWSFKKGDDGHKHNR